MSRLPKKAGERGRPCELDVDGCGLSKSWRCIQILTIFSLHSIHLGLSDINSFSTSSSSKIF